MNYLFDLDGTLADPFGAFRESMHFAFQETRLPLPSDSQLRESIGPPLESSLRELLKVPSDKLSQVLEKYRAHHATHGLWKYEFYPDCVKVLTELHGKHRLYVATSKPREMALPLLQHFKLDHLFAAIHGSEWDGTRSKKAELIAFVIAQENLAVADTLLVGDRCFDGEGAAHNGIRFYGAGWGYGSREELIRAGAAEIFQNWKDLEPVLLKAH